MLSKLRSITYLGLESIGVDVEVNISSRGMPSFDIVGLANKEIAESRQRVKTALQNSGIDFPNKKIIVNLAPADTPKEGSFYDLAIAAGIICDIFLLETPGDALFFGELSLDGSLRYTRGAISLALYAKKCNISTLFIPEVCAAEVLMINNLNIIPLRNLHDLVLYLKTGTRRNLQRVISNSNPKLHTKTFNSIVGHNMPKRALEICAAGGHNLLMLGPPGTGKTLLANAVQSILPELRSDEQIEVTNIYSLSGNLDSKSQILLERPFRSPHHSISHLGLLGGGANIKPGEITLAHRGILFLDELGEFNANTLEALRQPIEEGKINLTRHTRTISLPCRFTLIAASNLCPCGYNMHPTIRCTCTASEIKRYRKKISGPLLDRIDLQILVNSISTTDYKLVSSARDTTNEIRDRVAEAHEVQHQRFQGRLISTNAEMSLEDIKNYCTLSMSSQYLMDSALEHYHLSTRSYYKILKIARTIADLAHAKFIQQIHISEALQFRNNPTIIS